ncbi:unnamed protein product [Clavelina lepadiformis]|uniref:Transmembrane protein n=1 Tax=Clavelina lepadiformis TaxID=159417 RepID=A0ABP0FW80_CLALP
MDDSYRNLKDVPPMDIPKNLPSNAKQRIKVDTILWLAISICTFYYSDILNVILHEPGLNGFTYNAAILLSGFAIAIALYYIMWLNLIKGIDADDWEAHNSYGIPIATGSFVLSAICWIVAMWPVYGVKTPAIVFILFMGFIMLVSIIPSLSHAKKPSKLALSNEKWRKEHTKSE